MGNEKTIESHVEQTSHMNDDAGSAISRRQFSLGLSGILLTGALLVSSEHNTLRALAAKISSLPTQSGPQKLTPHAFNQPQYVLSGTIASVWSADSRYLASSGFDHVVHVWDAMLGQTVTMYKGHAAIVRDIAWSPNQQYLASTGYDKTVQVWEALTGMMVVTYSGHAAEIQALTWSPDSRLIASTDLQNKTMVWRVI